MEKEDTLAELLKNWASLKKIFKPQPFPKIKDYYSEQVFFYFSWLEDYKNFLKISAVFSLLIYSCAHLSIFVGYPSIKLLLEIFLCLFLPFWGLSFEKHWKFQEKKLAVERETLDCHQGMQEESLDLDLADDESLKEHNRWTSLVRFLAFISVLFCISLSVGSLVFSYKLRVILKTQLKWKPFEPYIVPKVLAIQIKVFDRFYIFISSVLTDWEKCKTVNEGNRSYMAKVFTLRFINNFTILYYLAFFKEYFEGQSEENRCLDELRYQLSVLFFMNMAFNLSKLLTPWVSFYVKKKVEIGKRKKINRDYSQEDSYLINQELKLETFNYFNDDYIEICLQYGFIVLFGASYPLLSIFALIWIYLQIRIDAIKLCKYLKKPQAIRAKDIGICKVFILMISTLALFNNLGIAILTSELFQSLSWEQKISIFLVLENFLIFSLIFLKLFSLKSFFFHSEKNKEKNLTKNPLIQSSSKKLENGEQVNFYLRESDLSDQFN